MRKTTFETLTSRLGHFLIAACLSVLLQSPLRAEQLPLKSLTAAEGLPSNLVRDVYEDRNGFIWLATGEGVGLYDGYQFKLFDSRDGLPASPIRSVTEDDNGRLWVTSYRGISRQAKRTNDFVFGANPSPRFETFSLVDGTTVADQLRNQTSKILFDSAGTLWCLTDLGLYRSLNPDAETPTFEVIVDRDSTGSSGALRDPDGTLWFGVGDELFEIRNGNLRSHGSVGKPYPADLIFAIVRDPAGRLLVSSGNKLFAYESATDGAQGRFRQVYSAAQSNHIYTVAVAANGTIWIGTLLGLIKSVGGKTTVISDLDSSPTPTVRALRYDRRGNLWMCLPYNGIRLLQSESITNYVPRNEINKTVGDAVEDSEGRIWAMLVSTGAVVEAGDLVERIFAEPVRSFPSAWLGRSEKGWMYGAQNNMMKVAKPLLRLRNGEIVDVKRFVAKTPGGTRFYEDSKGVLWIATSKPAIHRAKVDHAEIRIIESIIPETTYSHFGVRIEEDGNDGVWLFQPLFIGRIRNGTYQPVAVSDGLPERDPRSIFTDSRGWLWIGLQNYGVSVTKSPADDDPVFTNYSKQNSPIRSNAVRSITEDAAGRMYFATDNGISRLNIETREWKHYSTQNGLAGNFVFGVTRDRSGVIWASTERGLSRIDLGLEKPLQAPPQMFLTAVDVAGRNLKLPITGATSIPKLEFGPNEGNMTIAFVAPSFDDDGVKFQFRLNANEWSAPSQDRSVSFSNLNSGNYRFEVRAVTESGVYSDAPAFFEFVIKPPFWKEWWFVAGLALLVTFIVYVAYRARLRQLLMFERTRTRIATDLHDDIGTNLSKISFLSELLRMQINETDSETDRMLNVIGETSRESVGAMTDIVWAINPQKDLLADMVRRMRQHAEEVFLETDIALRFESTGDDREIKLAMDVRRELYLIFKEALNNALKYSACRHIRIFFGIEGRQLVLLIEDDGNGFEVRQETTGNGIRNMRLRAARIDADISIDSVPGEGTRIGLRRTL